MSLELSQIIAAAVTLSRKGQTPTLALLKAKVGGKVPMPLLVAGLQRFKAMTDEEIDRVATSITPTSITAEGTETAPAETQLNDIQLQIAQLTDYCHRLEQRIKQLENNQLEQD